MAYYGEKCFWVRPKEMFFQKIIFSEDKEVNRFEKIEIPNGKIHFFDEIVEKIRFKGIPVIKGSEDKQRYIITKIDCKEHIFSIVRNETNSGYLSDIYLAQRMGYSLLYIDEEKILVKNSMEVEKLPPLIIDDNSEKIIRESINPCSIDLTINKNDLLLTKRKKININSIVDLSDIEKYWKVYSKKRGNIIIKPGQGIYARVKEEIKIPEDCAGKIEIKNTFARLGLDITAGDFCNPGWHGNFPLFIYNRGNISIELTGDEKIAQLMLLKTGPTIEIYNTTDHAFSIKKNKRDDGFPYNFFEGRALKQLRRVDGGQIIVEAESKLREILMAAEKENVIIDSTNFDIDEWSRQYIKYMDKKRRKSTKNKDEFSKIKLIKYTKKFFRKQSFRNKVWKSVFAAVSICGAVAISFLQIFDFSDVKNYITIGVLAVSAISLIVYLYLKNFRTYAEIRFTKSIESLLEEI